jgi:hypothetical protein
MLTVDTIGRIRREHFLKGKTIKEIARDLKGTRILTDRELVKVWNACEGMFGAIIRLLILWGLPNWSLGRRR